MKFDSGRFDLEGFDRSLITLVDDLILLKCTNWAEGSSHGGTISTMEVISLFDDITEAENVSGWSDYRKAFIKANDSDVLNKLYSPVLVDAPEHISSRITLTIAKGTQSDTMITKPTDENFHSSISCDIFAGESQPIWVKRTITSIATLPAYERNISVSLMVLGEL